MDCAKFSHYISEFLDNRLGCAERKQVENHLEKCPSCKELRDDLLRIKSFCNIKKQEKPKKDYFEYLQCNIKRRILAQNVVTFREQVVQFCTRPSWAMTAVIFIAFTVSVSVNLVNYYKKSGISIAEKQLSKNVTETQTEDRNLFKTTGYSTKTKQPSYTIHSDRTERNSNKFILNSIPVRTISSNNQVKIYQ